MLLRPPRYTLFPYTTLFRSVMIRGAYGLISPGASMASRITSRMVSRAPLACVSAAASTDAGMRSEEHTSELQSRPHLVCRLLLEKKKQYCSEQSSEC